MWAQTVIIMLGVWLFLSPFIFGVHVAESGFLALDLTLGTLIISLGFFNCYYKNRFFSILISLVACWCLIEGYFAYSHPRPFPAQNHIAIGLLLLMFVIIPPGDKLHMPE